MMTETRLRSASFASGANRPRISALLWESDSDR